MFRLNELLLAATAVVGATLASAEALTLPQDAPPAKQDASKQDPAKPAAAKDTAGIPADKINVHGGRAWVGKETAFEIVFVKEGVRLYPYDKKGAPMSTAGLEAKGNIDIKTGEAASKPLAFKAVVPKPADKDKGVREFLFAEIDLSKMPKDAGTFKFNVTGLKSDTEKEVAFELPFTGLSPTVLYVCPKCKGESSDPGQCAPCNAPLEKIVKSDKT